MLGIVLRTGHGDGYRSQSDNRRSVRDATIEGWSANFQSQKGKPVGIALGSNMRARVE